MLFRNNNNSGIVVLRGCLYVTNNPVYVELQLYLLLILTERDEGAK